MVFEIESTRGLSSRLLSQNTIDGVAQTMDICFSQFGGWKSKIKDQQILPDGGLLPGFLYIVISHGGDRALVSLPQRA